MKSIFIAIFFVFNPLCSFASQVIECTGEDIFSTKAIDAFKKGSFWITDFSCARID